MVNTYRSFDELSRRRVAGISCWKNELFQWWYQHWQNDKSIDWTNCFNADTSVLTQLTVSLTIPVLTQKKCFNDDISVNTTNRFIDQYQYWQNGFNDDISVNTINRFIDVLILTERTVSKIISVLTQLTVSLTIPVLREQTVSMMISVIIQLTVSLTIQYWQNEVFQWWYQW